MQRLLKEKSARAVEHTARTSHGPWRRDPQGTTPQHVAPGDVETVSVLQGASAKGSLVDFSRRSRGLGEPYVSAGTAKSVAPEREPLEFGVGDLTSPAHPHGRAHAVMATALALAPYPPSGTGAPTLTEARRAARWSSSPRGNSMNAIIASLDNVSLGEALGYLDSAEGDELAAAFALAKDRNQLDGTNKEPDDAEVHHALFLLRRARGLSAPSFDLMRVQLRSHVAA